MNRNLLIATRPYNWSCTFDHLAKLYFAFNEIIVIANYFLLKAVLFFFAEEPQGTNDLCPRLNGFYAHPEPTVCNVFYACVDGVAEEYTCSPGLYFDEYKGVCNWPLDSERTNCKAGT